MDETFQATPPHEPQPPRKKSCLKTCLILAVVLALVGVLLLVGVIGAAFYFGVGKLKQSDPYRVALEQVQTSPEVIERLGEPIEDATRLPTGQFSVQNDQGSAMLEFKVKGPKGEAHVRTQSRMIDGVWGLTELVVTFADGERVVLDTGEGGENEAPPFLPPEEKPQPPPEAEAGPQIDLELPTGVGSPEDR